MGQGSWRRTRRAWGPASPGTHQSTVTIATDPSSKIRTKRRITVGFSSLEVTGDLDQKSSGVSSRENGRGIVRTASLP